MKKEYLLIVVLIGLAIAGGVLFLLNSGRSANLPPVKVGLMVPLSGDTSNFGFSIRKGAELAIKENNAESWLQLEVEDSGCDPVQAESAITRLLDKQVEAIIGEVCSGATLAVAPLANEAKTVLISPASTSPEITDSGPYIFRTVPSDSLQGIFASKLMFNQGYRRVAILYSDEAYGRGLRDTITSGFKELGGEVVVSQPVKSSVLDVQNQVDQILSKNPDVVYIIVNSPLSASVSLTTFSKVSPNLPLYGSEALKDNQLIEDLNSEAEGLIVTSVSNGDAAFKQRYRAEFNEDPGPFSAQAYDAVTALIKAFRDVDQDGKDLKSSLQDVEFNGVTGDIKFDIYGDVGGIYEKFIVENGEFVPFK